MLDTVRRFLMMTAMWDTLDTVFAPPCWKFRARRPRGGPVFARSRRAAAWSVVVAALVWSASAGRAQTFIRVEPPSTEEQDRTPVTAMPYASASAPGSPGAPAGAGTHGGPREAVLSGRAPAKILDANGKEVKKSGDWRDWRPTFYADLKLSYDDNIFIQPHKSGDFVTRFSPGVVLGWGDYRSELPRLGQFQHEFAIPVDDLTSNRYAFIDYHPTLELFASHSSEDTVEEDVHAAGSYQFTKLILQGSAEYKTTSESDIDVGDRVDRTLYSAALTALYTINDRTGLESGFTVTSSQFEGIYESSTEVADRTYLNFQIQPKTNIALGVGFGYLLPEFSANQYYEQLLARARWAASDKLYATGTVGLEVRESTAGINKVNGVYDGSINYQPLNGTQISLTSSRLSEPSEAEFGQNLVLTNFGLHAQQRFLSRFYVGGGVSYENVSYERVSDGPTITRNDNIVGLDVSVGLDFTQYAGIQLASSFLNNDSTLDTRTFDREEISFQVNVLY